jgi:hypothetical protein
MSEKLKKRKRPDNIVLGVLGDDPETIVQAAEMVNRLVDCPVCDDIIFDLEEHMREMLDSRDPDHLAHHVMKS